MAIRISERVRTKLEEKHAVSPKDVGECFENREGVDLFDSREEHKTNPPTRWFLAYTNHCRRLKVVYVLIDGHAEIKSAFPPNAEEVRIYSKHGSK